MTGVVVHERGHMADDALSDDGQRFYALNEDTQVSAALYHAWPARSLILEDAWVDARPPCPLEGAAGGDSVAVSAGRLKADNLIT